MTNSYRKKSAGRSALFHFFVSLALGVSLVLFALILFLLLFFTWADYPCRKYNFLSAALNPLLFLLIGGILALLFFRRRKFTRKIETDAGQKRADRAVRISLPVIYALQVFFDVNLYFETSWDADVIAASARELADGHLSDELNLYFSRCQNNVFMAWVYSLLLRVGRIFRIPDAYDLCIIAAVNSLIALAACYLVYRTGVLLTGSYRIALVGYAAGLLLMAFSPWNIIPYSDTPALAAPVLVFYFYLRRDWNPWVRAIGIALSAFIGYIIKPTVIFALLSAAAWELLRLLQIRRALGSGNPHLKQRRREFLQAAILTAAIFLALPQVLGRAYSAAGFRLDSEQRYSIYHFLMLGQNDRTGGIYADEDVNFSNSFDNYAERKAANIQRIKEQLQKRGFAGELLFTGKKLISDYNDGTFAWGVEGSFYKVLKPQLSPISGMLRSVFYSTGSHYHVFLVCTQFLWLGALMLLLLSIAGAIYEYRKSKAADIRYLIILSALVAITVYNAVFETRARYLYIYVPFYLIAAMYGIRVILLRRLERIS